MKSRGDQILLFSWYVKKYVNFVSYSFLNVFLEVTLYTSRKKPAVLLCKGCWLLAAKNSYCVGTRDSISTFSSRIITFILNISLIVWTEVICFRFSALAPKKSVWLSKHIKLPLHFQPEQMLSTSWSTYIQPERLHPQTVSFPFFNLYRSIDSCWHV